MADAAVLLPLYPFLHKAVESIPVYADIPSMSSVHDAERLDKPRVVVLGSGWASASFMKALPKQIK